MEERKWENLNEDCLVNIFGRLDVESLLLDVPLVCKQWYRATFNPLSWQNLVFPDDIYPSRSRLGAAINSRARDFTYGISKLIEFVVGRSQGCAATIVLPDCISRVDLVFVSDKCPSLKVLAVSGDLYDVTYKDDIGCAISDLLVKWKNLEVLKLDRCNHLVEIIGKIGLHCKNFVELSVTNTGIDDQVVAAAIVSNLSTIKRLVLDEAKLEKVNLELILRGCKELELLYVRDCVGFDEDDEEILMLASGIKDFQCEGSRNEYSSDDSYPHYDYAYDVYEDYAIYFEY